MQFSQKLNTITSILNTYLGIPNLRITCEWLLPKVKRAERIEIFIYDFRNGVYIQVFFSRRYSVEESGIYL